MAVNWALKAGMALGGMGNLMQGMSAYQQGRYNARIYEQQGRNARIAGLVEHKRTAREAERRLSAMRAKALAGGVELSGSPLLALVDMAEEFETDLMIQRYNTELAQAQARSAADMSRTFGTAALGRSAIGALGQGVLSYSMLQTPSAGTGVRLLAMKG